MSIVFCCNLNMRSEQCDVKMSSNISLTQLTDGVHTTAQPVFLFQDQIQTLPLLNWNRKRKFQSNIFVLIWNRNKIIIGLFFCHVWNCDQTPGFYLLSAGPFVVTTMTNFYSVRLKWLWSKFVQMKMVTVNTINPWGFFSPKMNHHAVLLYVAAECISPSMLDDFWH